MIEVIGLGQTYSALPLCAADSLRQCSTVVLQTTQGACAEEVMRRCGNVVSLDDVYESAESFDSLYAEGAQKILSFAKDAERTCFCCYGFPADNGFVLELQKAASVQFAGWTDPAAEGVFLARDLVQVDSYTALEARTLETQYLDTSQPLVVVGIDDAYTAAHVKLVLGEFYTDAFKGVLAVNGEVLSCTIGALDRVQSWTPYGVLVLPAVPFEEKKRFTYIDAARVMATLRAPDGCPWDREQSHDSLRPYLIEEAYEVSDAAAQEDYHALADELGDVLLQVLFHSQIGRECGEFTDMDVTSALCQKMIRRHPHVFGNGTASTSAEVLDAWEKIKKEEPGADERRRCLDGIPASMDPLMRALKLQKKAASVGFDWPDSSGALDKLREELGEFKEALGEKDDRGLVDEGGDVLFAVVNVLRMAGVDPQSALQDACRKFSRRFAYIEDHADKPLDDMTLDEMDKLWDQAKDEERTAGK